MARHQRREDDVDLTEDAERRRLETNAEMETNATAGGAEGEGWQGAAEAGEA